MTFQAYSILISKFFVIYLKILGLYPISSDFLSKIPISIFDLTYGVLIEIACLTYHFVGANHEHETSTLYPKNEVSKFTARFEVVSSALLTSFSHIFLLLRCKILLKLHVKLYEFFKKMNDEIFYKKIYYVLVGEGLIILLLISGYSYISYILPHDLYSVCSVIDRLIETRWALQFSALNLLFANVLFFSLEILRNIDSKLMKLKNLQGFVRVFERGKLKFELEEDYSADLIIKNYNEVISL